MTRFERELNGSLGAYWKAEAEKELARIKAELEAGKITIDDQGVALAVCPLVHVEAVNVLAVNVPLLQEVNSPLVHTHRTYGKNHSELFASFFRVFDLESDFVTHICIKCC